MLSYESPSLADAAVITTLYETYLNGGRHIREYVYNGLADPKYLAVKCVDTTTGQLVGILSARPGIEFSFPHPKLEEQIGQKYGTEGLYTADMLIVEPAYRGRGIAHEMMTHLKRGLKEKRVRYMLLEAWMRVKQKDIPAQGTFRDLGPWEVILVDHSFYQGMERYDMTCPECGVPCHCGAVISVIDLHPLWEKGGQA